MLDPICRPGDINFVKYICICIKIKASNDKSAKTYAENMCDLLDYIYPLLILSAWQPKGITKMSLEL
jgi:hypothetical protein